MAKMTKAQTRQMAKLRAESEVASMAIYEFAPCWPDGARRTDVPWNDCAKRATPEALARVEDAYAAIRAMESELIAGRRGWRDQRNHFQPY